jgi:hypothetical protein
MHWHGDHAINTLLRRTALLKTMTVLIMSGGLIGPCHIYQAVNPQSSDFQSEQWANSRGSSPQDQHPANKLSD